jgi:hypothetical protein
MSNSSGITALYATDLRRRRLGRNFGDIKDIVKVVGGRVYGANLRTIPADVIVSSTPTELLLE